MNNTPSRQRSTPRTPGALEQVWQTRTEMVKQQMEAESKANDAKTARLKALRLAQEAAAPPAPVKAKKPRKAKK